MTTYHQLTEAEERARRKLAQNVGLLRAAVIDLRALHQSGFVIVPVSTTPDMHEATSRCDCRDLEDTWAKVVALFAPPLQTKDKRNDG